MRRVILFAFFMFLKKVYKYNKFLFLTMIAFSTVQIFVSFNRGIVISPFFNYGMYSEAFNTPGSYPVFEIEQNGKLLRGEEFSPEDWDKIILPPSYYANIKASNALYHKEVKRILERIGITTNDERFLTACNYKEFEKWYGKYLFQITGQPTTSLKIYSRVYQYRPHKLVPTDAITPLAALCN
jgi:hypothetical protein